MFTLLVGMMLGAVGMGMLMHWLVPASILLAWEEVKQLVKEKLGMDDTKK